MGTCTGPVTVGEKEERALSFGPGLTFMSLQNASENRWVDREEMNRCKVGFRCTDGQMDRRRGQNDENVIKQILRNVHWRSQVGRARVSTMQFFQRFWRLDIFHNKMLENNARAKGPGCLVPESRAHDGKNRTLIVRF